MAATRGIVCYVGARLCLFDERCRAAAMACLSLAVLLTTGGRLQGHSGATRLLSTRRWLGTQGACVNLVTASLLLISANIVGQARLVKVRSGTLWVMGSRFRRCVHYDSSLPIHSIHPRKDRLLLNLRCALHKDG